MDGWTYTFAPVRTEKGLNFGPARGLFDRMVIAHLAIGEVCDLTISEHREKRSNAQNRMAWGTVYDQILAGLAADQYEPQERAAAKDLIHEGLCGKYQGYVTDPVTKQEVRKFRSSKATKQEFSDYIEWVARFAATEYGVVVVLPGEL